MGGILKRGMEWMKVMECAELPLPSTFTSKLIKLNSNNVLAITSTGSIYIYNIIDDKWTTPYGDWVILKHKIESVAVDYVNHEIYLLIHNGGIILKFLYTTLLKTNLLPEIKKIKLKHSFGAEKLSSSIFANEQLHLLFIGKNTMSHYIFYSKSSTLLKIFEFDEKRKFKPTLIHIKSSNKLMLFGSEYTTYVYSLHTQEWSNKNNTYEIYSLLQLSYQDCFIAPDEKHLIVFGGSGVYDKIHTINISDDYLKSAEEASINSPMTTQGRALLMEHGVIDDILIIGYYRNCWNNLNMPMLPNDIVELICKIAQREAFIHFFPLYKRLNYKINLRSVMEN